MSDREEKTSASLLAWMFRQCWRYRRLFWLAIAFQSLLAIFAVLGLNLIGLGVDYLASVMDAGYPQPKWPLGWQPPSGWSEMRVIVAIATATIAVGLGHAVLQFAAARSIALLVHGRLTPGLQNQVFRKLQDVCMRFYADNSTGSVINRATGDVQSVRSFVDLALLEAVTLAITFVVYAGYMVGIHVGLAAACLSVAPLMAVASVVFSRVSRPLFLRYREGFDRMILYLSETIRGAQVIKGFAMEDSAIAKMRAMNEELWDRQTRIFHSISVFAPLVNLFNHLGMFILLLYGGRLVIDGELALGTGLVVFAGLLQQYSNRISNVAQIANALQESLTGARRLREILSIESTLEDRGPGRRPRPMGSEVAFDRVSVAYQEGRSILEDVSFVARPGEMVALVGETGSGKTALLGLLPRLYDPASGVVRIGGLDTKEYELKYLRRHVGVVFQENFLFSASVRDNIRFGREDASEAEVRRAAERAQAAEFIEALDKGYDTVIGEFGVDLSGGQRQRLSIARALLHDPPILLLDDPTSAIDPGTEALILGAMRRAIEGRTTFIVAHRLATLKRADKIVLLDKGRVAGIGSHEALVERSAMYRAVIASQSMDEAAEAASGEGAALWA